MGAGMNSRKGSATRVDVGTGVGAGFAADYSDAFRIAAVRGHRAREWAQRSLGGADRAHGLFRRLVWNGLLGFELAAPGTAGTLVGWRIACEEPQLLVLEADGRRMAGRIVFEASDTALTWTTMLRYHRPIARAIWAAAGYVHRALTPRCLAAARLSLQHSGIGTRNPETGTESRFLERL
jgi:hypothetical protein